jgi:nucleoside-diphosphate-sugar epimerase
MTDVNKEAPVLVTGATGYVASWVVKMLLEDGARVRATVRDKGNLDKVGHLLDLDRETPGKLELWEADLLDDGAFDEALDGCEIVHHLASPFVITKTKDPQTQLVDPARGGTRNVLAAASRTGSVRQVVLTSSLVAIYGDARDIRNTEDGVFTEAHWNETSSLSHMPYSYSKTVAEQEAWSIARSQDSWDLVVINPGFVMGPSLTKRIDSTSIDFMLSMLGGKFKAGVPDMYLGLVDVRDVARAHLLAASRPAASGRHALVADSLSFKAFADILAGAYGDRYPIPQKVLPNFMIYLVGPLLGGLTMKYVHRNLGIQLTFDNRYSIDDLGLEYTDMEKTILDHAAQLIEDKLI